MRFDRLRSGSGRLVPKPHCPVPKWVAVLAKYGFAAKGIVYATLGLMTIRAAWMTQRAPDGPREALDAIGHQPFGRVLLLVTATGLAAYALWRLVQVIYDPDCAETGRRRLLLRTAFAVSGAGYASLAVIAASLAVGWRVRGHSERALTAQLLALPFGRFLVALAGIVVICVGIAQFYSAWTGGFLREYDSQGLTPRRRRWAKRLGRYGLCARGVTFTIMGFFLIEAARQSSAGKAKGLGGTFEVLAAQPMGPWLLLVVAVGLFAYGVYCLSRAWPRTLVEAVTG